MSTPYNQSASGSGGSDAVHGGRHLVTSYDDELRSIDAIINRMGKRAIAMTEDATRALIEGQNAKAMNVISEDRLMDKDQRDIDEQVVNIIGKRQPVAVDLRVIVGTMRMAGDLERIGDLAKNIAKRVPATGSKGLPRDMSEGMEFLSKLAEDQISGVIDHYSRRTPEGLDILRDRDQRIDALYSSTFRSLLTFMMEDPRQITPGTHLLFCAKNLERIGDHVTNIAENVYFMFTGEFLPAERPKENSIYDTE